jgi:hypothetical protein
MKLSENTVTILKNFAAINGGIVVKPGNKLRTISSSKAILAEAVVEETFPHEFGIYDLNKSLGLLSMNKNDNEVEILQDFLVFKSLGGKGTIRQRFTATNLILTPPNKEINIPAYEVKFTLPAETLNWIFSVASILKCPNVVVTNEDGKIAISAMDVKGEIVDDAKIVLNDETDIQFQATLKIENLKIVPDEYVVEIASMGVSRFYNESKKLTYWIAIEAASSNFGEG